MYFSPKKRVRFEFFISKRSLKSVVKGKKNTRPIIRISIISIALAIIVNLITIAVVTGFKQEIRKKISGFSAHFFIASAGEFSVFESVPIRKKQSFLPLLKADKEIKHVHPVGYKPVLFVSKDLEQHEILGAMMKGIDENFDWSFFQSHLIQGKIPNYNKEKNAILVSKRIADQMFFKVGDTVKAFFVKQRPTQRRFIVSGIYETGLLEFDEKTVLCHIEHVQELNDWGIRASIQVDDTLYQGIGLIVRARASGGNGNYRYDWGEGFEKNSGFVICPMKDTLIRVIVGDYEMQLNEPLENTTLPDTAYLQITIKGEKEALCRFVLDEENRVYRNFLDDTGNLFSIDAGDKELLFKHIPGKGTHSYYVGGFEVYIKDWEKLDEKEKELRTMIDFKPTPYGEMLSVMSIKKLQEQIFVWLDFLDINVAIIIILMILIGIINMGSALLVLILIRSHFIGVLKVLGANNVSIRKIFLIQAGYLILRGMFWGNLIGLTLCFLQEQFQIFTLNPEVYYLSSVPIELTFEHWFLINSGTLIVCLIALIIPSAIITKINPAKVVRMG